MKNYQSLLYDLKSVRTLNVLIMFFNLKKSSKLFVSVILKVLGGLRSKFTGKNWPFFIILIDSLYLQESVVQMKKFKKNLYIPKKLKKRESFSFKIPKTPQDFDSPFFNLFIYVINSSVWASWIFEKGLHFSVIRIHVSFWLFLTFRRSTFSSPYTMASTY